MADDSEPLQFLRLTDEAVGDFTDAMRYAIADTIMLGESRIMFASTPAPDSFAGIQRYLEDNNVNRREIRFEGITLYAEPGVEMNLMVARCSQVSRSAMSCLQIIEEGHPRLDEIRSLIQHFEADHGCRPDRIRMHPVCLDFVRQVLNTQVIVRREEQPYRIDINFDPYRREWRPGPAAIPPPVANRVEYIHRELFLRGTTTGRVSATEPNPQQIERPERRRRQRVETGHKVHLTTRQGFRKTIRMPEVNGDRIVVPVVLGAHRTVGVDGPEASPMIQSEYRVVRKARYWDLRDGTESWEYWCVEN